MGIRKRIERYFAESGGVVLPRSHAELREVLMVAGERRRRMDLGEQPHVAVLANQECLVCSTPTAFKVPSAASHGVDQCPSDKAELSALLS